MKMILLILLLVSVQALGQSGKDSTKGTVNTIYIIDHTDTIKVDNLIYKGENSTVKWCSPGWLIRKGQVSPNEKGGFSWIRQPIVIGGLDDKKKPVKPL